MADEGIGLTTDLTGKTALVTGATSGLGHRFATILARAGAKVAITGRRVERLEALTKEIESFDGRALPIEHDVTDVESTVHAVETASTELGPIDILVNNAGISAEGRIAEVTPEEFDATMNTNVRGAFFVATEVGKRMIERGQGGSIINLGSIGSHSVLPGLSVYCISKAAVAMMTKSMAREWARYQINVNAICPGYIETEINDYWFATEDGKKQVQSWPRRRLELESDLDGMLLLLSSDQSRAITGSVITIDDGQAL